MERINLKSKPVGLETSNIDAVNGILFDVVMAQEGPAKGHGVNLEASFIEDLINFDNKYFKKTGIKARFGHPAMCGGDPLGSQAGYFKNFRTKQVEVSQGQGKPRKKVMQAIADFHLLEASNDSPTHPRMREYILKMAAESPDFIMMSIVFKPGEEYQYNDKGEKVYVNYYDKENDKWVWSDDSKPLYVEMKEHYYTDVVEAGAATDSLFSAQFNQKSFAVQAIDWLNDNPSIKDFITANPEKVQEFLVTCGIPISKPTQNFSKTMDFLKKIFGTEDPAAIQAKLELANAELTRQSEALTQKDNEIAALTKARDEAQAALTAANEAHTAELATANETISKLSKESNGTHSSVQSELEGGEDKQDKTPAWTALKAEIDAMM